jgi:hypothetical protein
MGGGGAVVPDPFADIPACYGIAYFPSVGGTSEFWMPTITRHGVARYVYRSYDSFDSDTTEQPAFGIRCTSVAEAVTEIRKHMRWKSPQPLPRAEWKA